MSMSVNILQVRKVLGTSAWHPPKAYGPGWHLTSKSLAWTVIVMPADEEFIHASITGFDDLPSFEQLNQLHDAVFGDGHSYMVFPAPEDQQPNTLRIYGRADGAACMPDFAGEITQ